MSGTANSGGRNAKPTKLHLQAGTFQKSRHGGAGAEPLAGTPDPPLALTGEGLAEWQRMVEKMLAAGVLSRTDDAVLYEYCQLDDLSERLQAELDTLVSLQFAKFSVDGAGVEPKLNPAVSQLVRLRATKRQFLVELGQTPTARMRVTGQARDDAEDKKKRFFGQPSNDGGMATLPPPSSPWCKCSPLTS